MSDCDVCSDCSWHFSIALHLWIQTVLPWCCFGHAFLCRCASALSMPTPPKKGVDGIRALLRSIYCVRLYVGPNSGRHELFLSFKSPPLKLRVSVKYCSNLTCCRPSQSDLQGSRCRSPQCHSLRLRPLAHCSRHHGNPGQPISLQAPSAETPNHASAFCEAVLLPLWWLE